MSGAPLKCALCGDRVSVFEEAVLRTSHNLLIVWHHRCYFDDQLYEHHPGGHLEPLDWWDRVLVVGARGDGRVLSLGEVQ